MSTKSYPLFKRELEETRAPPRPTRIPPEERIEVPPTTAGARRSSLSILRRPSLILPLGYSTGAYTVNQCAGVTLPSGEVGADVDGKLTTITILKTYPSGRTVALDEIPCEK